MNSPPLPSSNSSLITIHGMGRLRWSMAHIGYLADRKGYQTFNFEYHSRSGSIRSHADTLKTFLDERVAPDSALHFITHSLGSIILRELAHLYPNAFNFRRAVMLGPPNSGSEAARFLQNVPGLQRYFGEPFRELTGSSFAPLSPLLETGVIAGVLSRHRAIMPWYKEPNDGLVSVSETRLEGSRDHRIVWCPHAVLMYSPAVLKETFYFLDHGTFSTSSRS